jgi:hypothetical protein
MNVFDPFDPKTWGDKGGPQFEPRSSSETEEANEEITMFVKFEDKQYKFDLELQEQDGIYSLLLAPRRVQGDLKGCVVMEWGMDDDRVNIANIIHDVNCSSKNVAPLEKKYGTRAMMLGSTHAMILIAKERFPHLKSFVLQDEATYNCPPLEKNNRTFASDLLIRNDTYYERHLNMEPVLERIKVAKSKILSRVHAPIRKPFDVFWTSLTSERDKEPEKLSWLLENMIGIREDYASSKTWRNFFIKMHQKHSCSFFAACGNQLLNIFHMSSMLGKQYIVKFEDLPNLSNKDRTGELSLVPYESQSGGGESRRRRMKSFWKIDMKKRMDR